MKYKKLIPVPSKAEYLLRALFIAAGVIIVTVCLLNCASGEKSKSEGIASYEGAAMGYRGIIRVSVSMQGGTITDIEILESMEDTAVGEMAIEELIDIVLMYNTTEVDAISGATETSMGFLEAVENAILNP